ncbi:Proteophosphoglycan ppg4, partial [Rhodotorula diobovata]
GYGNNPAYGQPQGAFNNNGGGGYQPQQAYGYSAPPPAQQQQQQHYAPPPVGAAGHGNSYAMQPMNGAGQGSLIGPDLGPFFAEVESIQDEIKQLQYNINHVSELHSRRLASTDDQTQSATAAQLTQLTNQTTGLTNSIRNRITKLNDINKKSPQGDPNFPTRKLQIGNLQNGFKRALEEYNLVEKRSREKYRDRMARQIKIVKPDATDDEIKAAWEDSQGGAQIFSQALMTSRTSGARAAFAEVQSRNQDLRKIEETITELAQMMQDMATLVLEQDESVRMIETQAVQVNTDVEQGLDQTKKARPDAFYPFLHSLTQYHLRPKRAVFSNPAFAPPPSGLDGKPIKTKYSDHNPVFTRLALANESLVALESTIARLDQWKKRVRGRYGDMHLGLAAQEDYPVLEAMRDVWTRREAEVEQPKTLKGECQSWADVGGYRACSMNEFWGHLGHKQGIERGPLKVQGCVPFSLALDVPQTYEFDHFLPAERDESLPLVVLYAAPSDEQFVPLFEGLYALAARAKPRLQLAVRWKPDTGAERVQGYVPDFAVEAVIKDGSETVEVEDVAGFTARAISFIRSAKDQFAALNDVASTLPLVAKDILATKPRGSLAKTSSLAERITFNGIPISPADMTQADVLALMRSERKIMQDLQSVVSTIMNEEVARDIILAANLTLEQPRKSANSLAIPTVDRPLRFVNLAEAVKGLPTRFIRASYIEGVGEENEEGDPAAISTFWVVADLDSDEGRTLVNNALRYAETTGEIRFSFVHNPATPTSSPDRFALSSLIANLTLSSEIAEAYPQEMIDFLDLKASDAHPPRRKLSDQWTAENPMTPFVEKGITGDAVKNVTQYWASVLPFAERVGVQPGEAAVILNGRVGPQIVHLDSKEFATGSFQALHQYELKRRIRPVHEACVPRYPDQVASDRRYQADMVAIATSVAACSADIHRLATPTGAEVKGLATITHGDRDRAMFELVAVLDPVGPLARQVAPFLLGLKTHTLVAYRVFLLPASPSTTLDLQTLSGRFFPAKVAFGEDQRELPHAVDFAGLPEGAVLDVKAFVPKTGEEFSGPGGKGGESVKVVASEGGPQVVLFSSAGEEQEAAGEEKAQHVRDEL